MLFICTLKYNICSSGKKTCLNQAARLDSINYKVSTLCVTPHRRCSLRSGSSDRSSEPPKADAAWQSPDKGAGVSNSSLHLPTDFLSHPAGHLPASDGWDDRSRWLHSARGELCSHFHNITPFNLTLSRVVSKCKWIFPLPLTKLNLLFSPCKVSILGDPPKDVNHSQSAFLSVNNGFPSGEVWFSLIMAILIGLNNLQNLCLFSLYCSCHL